MSAMPSPEIVAERMGWALAEAGYPDAQVVPSGRTTPDGYPLMKSLTNVPRAFFWMACDIAAQSFGYPCGLPACWACYETGDGAMRRACRNGDCAHPEGPARPPRSELVSR